MREADVIGILELEKRLVPKTAPRQEARRTAQIVAYVAMFSTLIRSRASSLLLGPWAALQRLRPPQHTPALALLGPDAAGPSSSSAPSLARTRCSTACCGWRCRRKGVVHAEAEADRRLPGDPRPKQQTHISMCPVCEPDAAAA